MKIIFSIVILHLFLNPRETIYTSASKISSLNDNQNNECTIYIAPSSIPNSGMGMYTTKSFSKGSVMLPADGPNIPIIDPNYDHKWVNLFSRYWWGAGNGVSDSVIFEADRIGDYQITMGSLPNSHSFLNNMGFKFPDIRYDDSLLDRSIDPGTGAYSYHTGRDMTAGRDVVAGEEIFLEYPSSYFDLPWMKDVPRMENYQDAGKILSSVRQSLKDLLLASNKFVDKADSKKIFGECPYLIHNCFLL